MITDSILLEWIGLGKKIRVHLLHELCPEGRNREREREMIALSMMVRKTNKPAKQKSVKSTLVFFQKKLLPRARAGRLKVWSRVPREWVGSRD
jgi:hypothetical protein